MKSCPSCRALCHDQARFCPTCGANVAEAKPSNTDPFLGHVLADKYLVKKLLGEGGMGRVYEAEQLALEKPVAVKILHQHLLGDENAMSRFVAEAQEASRLNHPNIVSVIEFGETSYNVMFIVMEYLRGQPLSDLIADEYPLPFRRVVHIFRQVLMAVGIAHQLGVLHRDIKPDNVFIETLADGLERVKVIDFGIAKRFDQQDRGLTSPGMVCGTPEYMSPEQVQGDPLDPRSDVYALGVLLYEMLVGTPPFLAKSPAEVMIMQAEDEPLSPSSAASDQAIPPSLDAIVHWALAKDRDERIESAEAFRRILDSWLLVSVQSEDEQDARAGVTCPSCGAFNRDATEVCIACGYHLPRDQPTEGLSYLEQSLSAERLQCVRESQRIPSLLALEDVSLDATASGTQTTRPGAGVLGYLPLVGREPELARVLQLVDTGGALRVVGEAGIGKSRLLDELASRARDARFWVIRLSPRDDTRFPSLRWPVRSLVAALLGVPLAALQTTETLTEKLTEVGLDAANLTGLQSLVGIPQPLHRQLSRRARQREERAAVQALVRVSAQRQRLALLFEDLHQMDAPCCQLVESFLAMASDDSLLVATTQAAAPGDGDNVPTLELHALGREAAVDLAVQKRQGRELSPEAYALLDVAGGNPFFVDQLVRLEVEGGLPGRLKRRIELLDARLDRLPLHLRQLLQRVAVHGGRLPQERLRAAFALPAEELDEQLGALEEQGLVHTGEDWVSARHALVEDAVLAGMPAAIRREAHLRFLEQTPIRPDTVGAAVRHALGSEDDQASTELLELGASVAWSAHDPARAIQWLQQALQRSRLLWGRGELGMEAHTRITVEQGRRLAEVLRQRGDLSTAEAVLREVQSFVSQEQPSLAAAIYMDQARHVLQRGNPSTAEEQLEQALKLSLADEEATWLHCELIYRLGELAARRGRYERALELFSEGFGLAEQLDACGHAEAWRFQVALGELLRHNGDRQDAEAYYHEAITTAERSGNLQGMQIAQGVLGDMLLKQGEYARAQDHLVDAVRHAERLGDRGTAAQLSLKLGLYAQQVEQMEDAAAHLRRAAQWGEAVGLGRIAAKARQHLADLPSSFVAESATS